MNGTMMYDALTTGSLIDHAARYHGGTEVVSIETDRSVARSTWGEVSRNARRLASALDRLGVAPGARCATIAWNNHRHLEIYFGVGGGGRVTHTVNPRLTPDQIAFILNDAGDEVLFFDQTFLPLAAAVKDRVPSLRHFFLMAPLSPDADASVPGLRSYDTLLETGDPNHVWAEIDERRAAALCYTSGTTGNPKGVQYSHRSLVLHSLGGNQPDGLAISARDTVLPVVPMFHVNAWGVPYVAASVGAKLILPGPGLDGESLARLIDAESVTIALGVPTIWMGLLAALAKGAGTASTLKRTVVGGAPLPPSMITEFREKYGTDLIHAWGMTETSPLGTLNQLLQKHDRLEAGEQNRIRQCQGRPPCGVALRLVDEAGTPLPHDGKTQGQLQIRGHWIVQSYYGKGQSALTDDGWFDTGDIATIDPDGYMTIRDRAKDIIKSGGEWISTVELENIAMAHPSVANAAVIAARHRKWDERPVVIAVPREGAATDEASILESYHGKVAGWQVPDKVIFVPALPLGATGKVLKAKLREEFGGVLWDQG